MLSFQLIKITTYFFHEIINEFRLQFETLALSYTSKSCDYTAYIYIDLDLANINPLSPVFTLFSHRNKIIISGTPKERPASEG